MSNAYQVILQFRQQPAELFGEDEDRAPRYHVQVVKAPGRGWGGPMLATGLDENQVRIIRNDYRGFVARQQAGGAAAGAWTLQPLRRLGNQLFEALPESVQTRLQGAQAYAQERGRNLEVRLAFELSAAVLLDLPWELLHDPDGRFFYGLRGGGVIRELVLPTATPEKPFYPVKTLGLWAEPGGVESLAERRRFSPAPGKDDGITWLQGADSLAQLRRVLGTGAFDSLHLVAHGRVGSAWDFALALADAQGRPYWLNPDQLAVFLGDYPALRFVYLDVCAAGDGRNNETDLAQLDTTPGGAAGQLLGVGVTVVVVMQDRISQAASGLMAETFYREMAQGVTLEAAMTGARRAVQLQQADAIHWSVPALYAPRPSQKNASPVADWVLDEVATPAVLSSLLAGLFLALLLGRLSFALGQVRLNFPPDWLRLPALLVESALIPILTAAMTAQGQDQLADKYGYTGRGWLPFLWHKYFSAFVWAMTAWLVLWLTWLGMYWSGIAALLGTGGQQVTWAAGLAGVTLAAHVGARQAIRQDLLFRRVGFNLFQGSVLDVVVLLVLLLTPPFLPLALGWAIWRIWSMLGGAPAGLAATVAALLVLGGAGLRLLFNGQKKPG